MNRCLEIENRIQIFIDEYKRNYNRNLAHMQLDQNIMQRHLTNQKCFSLSSINSAALSNNEKMSTTISKSESDLHDMLQNKNYTYYMSENSNLNENYEDYDDVDMDDVSFMNDSVYECVDNDLQSENFSLKKLVDDFLAKLNRKHSATSLSNSTIKNQHNHDHSPTSNQETNAHQQNKHKDKFNLNNCLKGKC